MKKKLMIKHIKCYHKFIQDSWFEDKSEEYLLCWIHPDDKRLFR